MSAFVTALEAINQFFSSKAFGPFTWTVAVVLICFTTFKLSDHDEGLKLLREMAARNNNEIIDLKIKDELMKKEDDLMRKEDDLIKKDIDYIKEDLVEIKADLKEIKAILMNMNAKRP